MEHRNIEVPVVFLLDTSSSMRGEGFDQMKKAFVSIIQGYKQSNVKHNVAVITFGKEVDIAQNFSNDHNITSHLLDDVVCEGPSELGKALGLAVNALVTGHRYGQIGPFCINERLVIISGGHATTDDITEDIEYERDEKMNILQLVGNLHHACHIVCVPVGRDPDMCFLGSIVYSSNGGKLLNVDEAGQFARYSSNMIVASDIIGKLPTIDYSLEDVTTAVLTIGGAGVISEKDLSDVYEILTNRQAFKMNFYSRDSIEIDLYGEKDSRLPPIGTRVRRGVRWPYIGQDSNVCGTVIGHRNDHHNVAVEWDTSMAFPYHYDLDGDKQSSHVIVCDEPRILLQREKIAVGCLVQRGPDWKWLDQDGGEGNIGSVYRVKKDNTVHVRWPNGKKSNYRFGYDGKYDVSLCDPYDENVRIRMKEQQNSWCTEYINNLDSNNGTKSKYNEGSIANAFSSMHIPKEENQIKKKDCENLEENDKSSGEGRGSSPAVQYEIEAVEEKDDTNCNSGYIPCSWEWKTKQGKWVPFPKSENDKIQKAFEKNRKGTVLVKIDDDLYRVVLSKMIQIKTSNREFLDIRRLS